MVKIVWSIFSLFIIFVYAADKISLYRTYKKCTEKLDATIVDTRYSIYNTLSRDSSIRINVFYRCGYEIDNLTYKEESIMPHRFTAYENISNVDIYIKKSVGDKVVWVYNPDNKSQGYILDDKNLILEYLFCKLSIAVLALLGLIFIGIKFM